MPYASPPFYLNYLEYTEAPPRGSSSSSSSPPPYDLPSLRLRDLMPRTSERLSFAIVSNYLVSGDFFLEELGPLLRASENGGHCIFGDKNDHSIICRSLGTSWSSSVPKMQAYGTMHSKFIFLFYLSFVRIAIFSNNFLAKDWRRKTGTLYVQDFPRIDKPLPESKSDEFRSGLLLFFETLKARECAVEPMDHTIHLLNQYSFLSAKAHIISSVPGTHETSDFGHLRVRSVLKNVEVCGRILAQYSSQGSTTQETIDDFLLSFRGGKPASVASSSSSSSSSLKRPRDESEVSEIALIWPTAEFIRRSTEGWSGGQSVPCAEEKLIIPVTKLHHVYDSSVSGRGKSVPHQKTFLSVIEDSNVPGETAVEWIYIGSHNFGPAAWGRKLSKGSKGKLPNSIILSFELGVIFTPETYLQGSKLEQELIDSGSIPPRASMPHEKPFVSFPRNIKRVKFFPASLGGLEAVEMSRSSSSSSSSIYCIPLSIPFSVHPKKYTQTDQPWCTSVIPFIGIDGLRQRYGNDGEISVSDPPYAPLLTTI